MSRHSFTIEAAGLDLSGDDEGALFAAGCDDALVAVVNGRLLLDFDRDAASFDAAVSSASKALRRAGADVVGVTRLAAHRT